MDKKSAQQNAVAKGCKCVKSACRKSYCVCFKEGVSCKAICQCVGCENLNTERAYVVNPSIVEIPKTVQPLPVEDKSKKKNKILAEPVKEEPIAEIIPDRGFDESFISNEDIKNVSRCLFAAIDQGMEANLSDDALDEIIFREAAKCFKGLIDKIKIQAEGLVTPATPPPRLAYETIIVRYVALKIITDSNQMKLPNSEYSDGESFRRPPKLMNAFHNPIFHNGLPHPLLNNKNYLKYYMTKNQHIISQEITNMFPEANTVKLHVKVEDTYIPFIFNSGTLPEKPNENDEARRGGNGATEVGTVLPLEEFSEIVPMDNIVNVSNILDVGDLDDIGDIDDVLGLEDDAMYKRKATHEPMPTEKERKSEVSETMDHLNETLRHLFELDDY